jgi:serine/threonine-protein kinase RsbW
VKPNQTVFRITLRSIPRSIRRVETYLDKINATVHLNEIQMHKVMVSLTEAVNNAIIHGNKSDPEKKVTVRCEVLPGWLLFIVEDHGRGFKLDQVKNPLKEENLMRESGRGIFLMRTLMDKVEYEVTKTGTQVKLWLDTNK